MGFFDKLFNIGKTEQAVPLITPASAPIRMGRYSDNNKSLAKTKKWYLAEDLFKEKKYNESIEALFDYLRDEAEDNVQLRKEEGEYTFEIYQGTKIVKGRISENEISATVPLAQMETGLVSVMRRLLEMNYSLYYSRFALSGDRLCMVFDSPRISASPNKVYYGLKELATKADKQDDLLVTDFNKLKPVEDQHVEQFPEQEKEVKYKYFRFWIENTLKRIDELNQDSFSGGIAYMLLALIYRLDFMIVPEGKLLNEIERISKIYWNNKDEKNAVERNQLLKDAFRKLLNWDKAEVLKYFYRARATFAINMPKPHSVVADNIKTAIDNMTWYRDNKHPEIALDVMEYGLSYTQFSHSLPLPVTELFTLYMYINHPAYFEELGFQHHFVKQGELNAAVIKASVQAIINASVEKYPLLKFDTEALDFESQVAFNYSYLRQVESLNFENLKYL